MNKLILTILSVTILFVSCNDNSKNNNNAVSIAFSKMLDNYYEEGLKLNPINATFEGDFRYNDSFPNTLSDEYKSEIKRYYENYLEKSARFKNEDLSESEKMSKAILKWECEIKLEGLKFREDLFPLDQTWSINFTIGQFATGISAQPFNTVKDYDNWLKRLEGYVEWMDSAESKMKEGIKLGYVLPKSLIMRIIPQLKGLAVEDLNKNLFYTPVKNFPKSFSENEKKILTEAYSKMITDKTIPAYKSLYRFMSTEYLAAGRETSGIGAIPNGEAYYKHKIKTYTTTNMTADEIYQIGLKEVSRILAEMEKVKEEVGYKGNLKSFFNYVKNKKELIPFTEPQQVIENFNAIHNRIKPQIENLFDRKPKTPFEVRRTESFREKSTSAEYTSGSLDGTRPGIFYIPIRDVTKYNIYSDESLFLHEAIPGHHYQVSLTQENDELPKFRKTLWYSGYGEGWALYAESLGKELGLYTDPYQYFGMLGAEIHRAIRLVVDTGIHSKGWSREKAIQYSLDNEPLSKENIISEIERYMANPGQALSYKIGQMEIRELRTKAENELGGKFDIKQFHNHVLEIGCVPLLILEEKINNWIESNKPLGTSNP